MRLGDFSIGGEFTVSSLRYRCTDVGTRVIVAVRVDDDLDASWYNGPPYALAEYVFDENDMPACEPS